MEIKIDKKTYNIRNYNEQDYDAVMNIHFKELDNVGVLVRENVSDVDLDNINKYGNYTLTTSIKRSATHYHTFFNH